MNRPNKPFCEFCFSDDCDKCKKLKAYKQGREEAINTIIQRLEHMNTLSFGIVEVDMIIELIKQIKEQKNEHIC